MSSATLQRRPLVKKILEGPDDNLLVIAGLGSSRPDLGQARASWQEARLATRIGESLPRLGPVLEWGRLGVYRLLARIPPAASARSASPSVKNPTIRSASGSAAGTSSPRSKLNTV